MTGSQFWIAALVHWLGLAALAATLGGLALALLVLPAAADLGPVRQRLRRWNIIAAVLLLATTAGELVVRARTMSGAGLGAAIAALPVVLARTHFGTIWIARTAVLAVLLLLLWASARARPPRAIALMLAAGVALTTSLTGHAGDWGDVSPTVFVDWVHALAAGAWVGGLGGLALVGFSERAAWPPALFAEVARRFSRLAGWCLLGVVLSGAYNAWIQVGAVSALWTTTYGRALGAKLALLLGLVSLGAVNRFAILPRLGPDGRTARGIGARLFRRARLALCGRSRVPREALPARLASHIAREAVLALAILGCTAVLGESPPGRHASRAHHTASAAEEPQPYRVTMAELHATGGVPKGWMFTPPTGDPRRGRQVFVRLGCFACHSVRGETFAAPSGPGPDLTGMGAHHPAGYIAESIVNPNAVIVRGPGYTGPDGLSVMPDYRGNLTVNELTDLVAYLKSL